MATNREWEYRFIKGGTEDEAMEALSTADGLNYDPLSMTPIGWEAIGFSITVSGGYVILLRRPHANTYSI
jgi:hypothetical protein